MCENNNIVVWPCVNDWTLWIYPPLKNFELFNHSQTWLSSEWTGAFFYIINSHPTSTAWCNRHDMGLYFISSPHDSPTANE